MITVLFPFVGGTIIGGSHVSALTLAANLDRRSFVPKIVLLGRAGELGGHIRRFGLDYDELPDVPIMAPKYSRSAEDVSPVAYVQRSLGPLRRYLARVDADVVHTNDGRMHTNWALPTKLAGRRLVWHHREGPNAFGVNKLAPLLADRIIGVSHFSKPARPIRSIDSRFRMVRSPFDLPDTRPDHAAAHARLCTALHLDNDAVLLAYFGILNDRKRPLHFVQAIRSIQNSQPHRKIHGLIFGSVEVPDSRLDARCRDLAAELGIADRIHLMGFRSPVHDQMAGVDALLVTAINEPFGRTLIEAMHLGTPVIATRHGGNVEAIRDGETGFLVGWEDPAAFGPPVERLLGDPTLRARIAAAAQADVARNYGIRRHVDDIEAEYRALVPHPPERRQHV